MLGDPDRANEFRERALGLAGWGDQGADIRAVLYEVGAEIMDRLDDVRRRDPLPRWFAALLVILAFEIGGLLFALALLILR